MTSMYANPTPMNKTAIPGPTPSLGRNKYCYAGRHDYPPTAPKKSCLEAMMKAPIKHNIIEAKLTSDRAPYQAARINAPILLM